MLIEAAVDTYQNATIFIKAFNNEADLGVGDLSFPNTRRSDAEIKQLLPCFINSLHDVRCNVGLYLAFTVMFFAQVMGLILEVQALTGGTVAFLVPVFLFVLMVSAFQLVIWKIKSKFLKYLLG